MANLNLPAVWGKLVWGRGEYGEPVIVTAAGQPLNIPDMTGGFNSGDMLGGMNS